MREPGGRFRHRQLKYFVNRFFVELNLEHMGLETFAFAFRAADKQVAQKLHLDFLESGPVAPFAAAGARVEGKRTCGQSLRLCFRRGGKQFPHPIVKSEIQNRG